MGKKQKGEPNDVAERDEVMPHVVGIGASAGGLEALQEFFDQLPDQTGYAYIIVQHLSPDFRSMMVELLSKHTKMPIHTSEDGMIIEPNRVYLIPRRVNMVIQDNALRLIAHDPKVRLNLPIDMFLHSLGEAFQERAIGIILSGTGTDGSRGIKTIKEQGGLVMVQDPVTAKFDGMPKSSLTSGISDFTLSPADMARAISKLSSGVHRGAVVTDLEGTAGNEAYDRLINLMRTHSGISFEHYRRPSMTRRIDKRMRMNGVQDMDAYLNLLSNPNGTDERNALLSEFLISVTRFFRDKGGFEYIQENIIPKLFKGKSKGDQIRVWVMGCATGEEAYSLAFLIHDYIESHNLDISYKIFATDVDRKAISYASFGNYNESVHADIPHELLAKYMQKKGTQYNVSKTIRDNIVFAVHDVLCDPPFIKLDMVSCRNFLIYIVPSYQKKLLVNFRFCLNDTGFLFLGPSESVTGLNEAFELVEAKWNIYRTKSQVKLRPLKLAPAIRAEASSQKKPKETKPVIAPVRRAEVNEYADLLMAEYLPDCLLVRKDLGVLFIRGNVERIFSFPKMMGAELNLSDMSLGSQLLVLRNGIDRSIAERKEITFTQFPTREENNVITISLRPVWHARSRQNLILIELGDRPKAAPLSEDKAHPTNMERERNAMLERELKETRSELDSVIHELESSNEELQASNEELLAANEELQSTNEELQSLNEELYTVNTELQAKITELTVLNDDINNMLRSTDLGTIFLDTNLCVRKFTPAIVQNFNLEQSNIGRPVTDFTHNLSYDDLYRDCQTVLMSGRTVEREIKNDKARNFLMRILPYRIESGEADGVVIMLIDIEPLKQTQQELELSERRFQGIVEEIKDYAIVLLNVEGRIESWNSGAEDIHHYTPDDVIGNSFGILWEPRSRASIVQNLIRRARQRDRASRTGWGIRKDGTRYWGYAVLSALHDQNGDLSGYVLIIRDMTAIKATQRELEANKRKLESKIKELKAASRFKSEFLANISHELRTPMNNIVLAAQLLRENCDDKLSVKERRYSELIQSSSLSLMALINDILDDSKIESGRLNINSGDINLDVLIDEIKNTYTPQTETAGIEFRVRKSKDAPQVVNADPVRLDQILKNLLSNALKFTEHGGRITVTIAAVGPDDDWNMPAGATKGIRFRVIDTGIGIPEEEQQAIFQSFRQVDSSDTKPFGGTGLGLSISTKLARMMGGYIDLQSTLGDGSTFSLYLPQPITVTQWVPEDEEL